MTDRERVIKGLECHMDPCAPCADCPYDDQSACDYSLWGDALELLKKQPKWIPVEEKLPDKDGRYLVCDGSDVLEACFSLTGQFKRPEWYTTDCYESEDLDHVTHWMPLPNPPEGESE